MSAARNNRAWLQDLLTSIGHIEAYTHGLDFEHFRCATQSSHRRKHQCTNC